MGSRLEERPFSFHPPRVSELHKISDTNLADDLLAQFLSMIEHDPSYQDRLERHYEGWKAIFDDPTHPDHARVRSTHHDDPAFRPAFPAQAPLRRQEPRTGPNAPCPCGSGKKFKKCCRA
jgi:hypothetical protein